MHPAELKALYERDFAAWAEKTAYLLEHQQFEQLDLPNLIEEVWDLSKRERDRLLSSLRLILHHLLKWQYQPMLQSTSWENTIYRERLNLQSYLEDSPSLKRYLEPETIGKAYRLARMEAIKETRLDQKLFPDDCPYSVEQILELEFWPKADSSADP